MGSKTDLAYSETKLRQGVKELAHSYLNGEDKVLEVPSQGLSLDSHSLEDLVARAIDDERIPGSKRIERYSPRAEYVSGRVRMFTEVEERDEKYVLDMELPFEGTDDVLDQL